MYNCPSCGRSNVACIDVCPCGADLTLLTRLGAIADAWFNKALECLAGEREGAALEWLAACCAARPSDAAALVALAKVWARIGRWDDAESALARAADVDATLEGLEAVRLAISQGKTRGLPTKGKASKVPGRGRAGKSGRRRRSSKAKKARN